MQNKAFDLLIDLAQKSQACALALPKLKVAAPYWSGIGFKSLDCFFVVPLLEVSEVLVRPTFTPVPGMKSWLCGLTNLRGKVLPIVDLASFFAPEIEKDPSLMQEVLVIALNDMTYSGILIEKILGLQKFSTKLQAIKPSILHPNWHPFILGTFQGVSHEWIVLSLKDIVGSEYFNQIVNTKNERGI